MKMYVLVVTNVHTCINTFAMDQRAPIGILRNKKKK